jgi:hypothetical protein
MAVFPTLYEANKFIRLPTKAAPVSTQTPIFPISTFREKLGAKLSGASSFENVSINPLNIVDDHNRYPQ